MTTRVALDEDFHVHSTFSDGISTLAENVTAARERRLRTLGLVDHVRSDTTWVPDFALAVSRYRSLPDLKVVAGVEAKILDAAGQLDIPLSLGLIEGIDLVLIADHQFPGHDGPVHPAKMRAAIERGDVSAHDAIECLVKATTRALGSARQRPLLAHLFSVLPKIGLGEEQVPASLLSYLATGAIRAGGMVEINEKWRCPSPRTVTALAEVGVHLVAGSDSHHCTNVGVYESVRETVCAVTQQSSAG